MADEKKWPDWFLETAARAKARLEALPPGYRPVIVAPQTGCGCRWYEGIKTQDCGGHRWQCTCGHPGAGCYCYPLLTDLYRGSDD